MVQEGCGTRQEPVVRSILDDPSSGTRRRQTLSHTELLEWIDNSRQAFASDGNTSKDCLDGVNLASALYEACLRLYVEQWGAYCQQPNRSSRRQAQLREQLGFLLLWGEMIKTSNGSGYVNGFPDFRDAVLEVLCNVGKTLIRSVEITESQPKDSPVVVSHDDVAAMRKAVLAVKVLLEKADLPESFTGTEDDSDLETYNCEDKDTFEKRSICDTRSQLGPTRVARAIRVKIKYMCHRCNTQYGNSRTCAKCTHQRCDQCLREPPRGSKSRGRSTETPLSDQGQGDGQVSSQSRHKVGEVRFIKDMESHIACLKDLAPTLEQMLEVKSEPQRLGPATVSPIFHVSDPARPFVLHIHDKYRQAPKVLVERLGEANWQRFVKIRKQMAGHEKNEGEAEEQGVALSTFQPISKFHDSGLGASMPTKSAPSVASHTSFLSSHADAEGGTPRVPHTPEQVAEGHAFVCFICGTTLTGIKSRIDWKIHVFKDLQPYICTFESCHDMLVTFPTRKLWYDHECSVRRHRQIFRCSRCHEDLDTEAAFRTHLSSFHTDYLNEKQSRAAVSAARLIIPNPVGDEKCPLCLKSEWTSVREFTTHVARHMEGIALASLPKNEDTDSEHEDESQSSRSFERSTSFGPMLNIKVRKELPQVSIEPHLNVAINLGPPNADVGEHRSRSPLSDRHGSMTPSTGTSSLQFHASLAPQRPDQRTQEPPRNNKGQIYCNHEDCVSNPPTFSQPFDWNKHMDGHELPYRSREDGCHKVHGNLEDLKRHLRAVHNE